MVVITVKREEKQRGTLLLHSLLLTVKAAHALVVIPTPGGWTQ